MFLRCHCFMSPTIRLINYYRSNQTTTSRNCPLTITSKTSQLSMSFTGDNLCSKNFILTCHSELIATRFRRATFLARDKTSTSNGLQRITNLLRRIRNFTPSTFVRRILPFKLFIAWQTNPITRKRTTIRTTKDLYTTITTIRHLFCFTGIISTFVGKAVSNFLPICNRRYFQVSRING